MWTNFFKWSTLSTQLSAVLVVDNVDNVDCPQKFVTSQRNIPVTN